MSLKRRRRGRIIPALVGCFYAGIAVGWLLHAAFTPRRPSSDATAPAATVGESREERDAGAGEGTPDNTADPTSAVRVDIPTIGADPIAELRRRELRLPVDDADIEAMKGDFSEHRGERAHEAVDILAARNTPVHAVENGTIAKLFYSKAGGTTLYQFDPSEKYCYYYAHLEHYAPGVREGMRVAAGDVIGYVGTSGNAPPGTPHLHFAIFELTGQKRWWEGRPLDPYLVYEK